MPYFSIISAFLNCSLSFPDIFVNFRSIKILNELTVQMLYQSKEKSVTKCFWRGKVIVQKIR